MNNADLKDFIKKTLQILFNFFLLFQQENVSCLNTTLVFLMFANRKDSLPKYLRALQDEKDDLLDSNISGSIMGNFRYFEH